MPKFMKMILSVDGVESDVWMMIEPRVVQVITEEVAGYVDAAGNLLEIPEVREMRPVTGELRDQPGGE